MRFCILIHSLWIPILYSKKIEMGSKFLDIPLTIEWVGPSGCEEKHNCDDEGYSFISEAFSIAISTINNDQTVPFFQNLTIRYVDSMGKNTISTVAEACKMPKSLLIMGLSSDCMVESSIASYYTKFTITDNCMVDSKSLSGFEKTSLFLKPSVESISQSFIRLLQEFKWKNVALISPSNLEKLHVSRRDQLKDRLIKSGVSVLLDSRYDVTGNKNYFVKKVEKDTAEARIFLIYDPTINLPLIRNFLYSLAELQLFSSGDYFVIGYFGFDSNREWVDQSAKAKIFNIGAVSPYNISSASLPLLYRNALLFSDAPPPSSSNDQWKKLKTQIETKLKKENSTKASFPYWDRVSRTMDGLYLWTKIGTEMLNVGLDITNGSIIYENMMDRKYKSVTGYDEYIDYNGFSLGSTIVYNFMKSIERGGEYGLWEVGRIGLHSDDNNIWYIDPICEGLVVNWINGIPPRDVPECGFKGELCIKPRDRLFIILICVVITVVCVLIVIAAILYRRYRFERRLHSLSFLIDRRDIVLKKHLNLLSMRSMRSMTSMRGSFMGSEIKNSHFLVEDYETRDPSNPVDSIAAIIDAGPLKDGEDPLDAKWNNLGEFAVGMHEGTIIAMKRIFKSDIDFTRGIRKEIITIQECSHENVLSFRGLICHPPNIFIVSEMANRGSLKDLLDNNELPLDDLFLNQMSKDIVQGLEYLHSSEVGCHGRLKSSNCLIDARWMVRLSSFGLAEMRANENAHKSEEEEARDDFWTAPELLRWGKDLTAAGSLLIKKADIYSLSILFYEIFGRCGPWGDEPMDPTEIIDRVRQGTAEKEKEAFRPDITLLKDCPAVLQETVSAGWAEDPVIRPGITHIRRKLKILTVGLKKTIMDSMVSMIEKYTTKLEIDINERNFELAEEKKKSEQLLKMMLPPVVAESLKNGNAVAAESFNSVTVFFSDCPGFVDLSATSKPIEIVQFLNDLYTLFDGIINRYDVYKVETIADAYMVVSGLPVPNGPHHAGEIASLGLALLQSVKSFTIRHRPEEKVKLRIGIHSGPCVAGVVGLKMPRYCLFGDTVNTASRMESNGIPLMINCSQTTRDILVQLKGFDIEERGMIEMKGKGLQMTYFVKGEDTSVRRERLIKERIKYPTLRNTAHSEELEALLLRM